MLQFKSRFLTLLRNKSMVFWTLLFPLILGTFFNIAFGSIMETTESFSQIPVAVVVDEDSYFTDVLDELSEGEDALISPQYTELDKAKELLDAGEVEGIFVVDGEIRLIVSEEGINQSILNTISDSYLQISGTIGTIAQTRPDMIEAVVAGIYDDLDINNEITLGTGETDSMLHYFYSLIAMACLFGSFFGGLNVVGIQGDRSSLAVRRCVSPVRKISMIFSDFCAAVILLFLIVLVVLAYLVFILGISFGDTWGFVILTCFVGCIVGVSFGTFVAAVIPIKNQSAVEGILTGLSLLLCFLSGLMVNGISYLIEQYVPIVNRINPAILLADAFYCLTVYDNYSHYTVNMVSLLIISAIFCVGSAMMLRRKQYASI